MRFFSFCLLLLLTTSCSYFSSNKKVEGQVLDTIVDFTKVDVSPSFSVCDKLIDEAKTKCFRANMHQQLTKRLRNFSFPINEIIDETIIVVLLINQSGKVSLQEVQSSDFIQEQIPDLLEFIEKSIDSLPKLQPAIKRGIPVVTQYELPIQITTSL